MNLSINNSHIYTQVYTNYGDALQAYLDAEFGRGGKKKLAKMLAKDPKDKTEVHSQQVNIGRWTHSDPDKRKEPYDYNKDKIHNSLNICISENKAGEWAISRTEKKFENSIPLSELDDPDKVDQKLDREFNRLKDAVHQQGVSDNDRDILLEYLRGRARSLSKELQQLADGLEKLQQNLDRDRD